MEFPDLGSNCYEKSCNRLDFLPMKCDACSNIFCKDHFRYSQHSCNNAYQKDVQVPVCPLCNKPVPSKRGEQPDIAVGQHIDADCKYDSGISNKKIYTNKCSVKGCKQKEVIRLTCENCHRDYCLKHRHQTDHDCQKQAAVTPSQAAGAAAIARAQNGKKPNKFPWFSSRNNPGSERRPPEASVSSVQGRMSEDEALALALQNSLNEVKPKSVQEEEDRLLAQALATCEMDQNSSRQRIQPRDKNCAVS